MMIKKQCLGKRKIEMNELPEEIMREILSRIPAQSLSQCCRLVSKDWYNLIKDPDFINLHHSRIRKYGSSNLIALCRYNTESFDDETEQFFNLVDNQNSSSSSLTALNIHFDSPQNLKLVGSANSLMCLCSLLQSNDFYICNPVTREILHLPKAPGLGPYSQKYNLEYVLHGSSGFGFHAATNTYKVVRTWFFRVNGADIIHTGIEIFTLGSGVWRWIHQDVSSILCTVEVSHLFLNQALHWQIEEFKDLLNTSEWKHYIGVIDIGDETFRKFGKPIQEHGIKTRTLSSLRNCLCLIDQFNDHIAVWTMKEYGVEQSWTKEHMIRKEMFGSLQTMSFDTLTTIKNGIFLIHGGECKGYYDFEKQEFKQIPIDGIGIHSPPGKLQIVVHIGSLISPQSITCTSDALKVSSAKSRRPIGFRLKKNVKKPSRPFTCNTQQQMVMR